MPTIIIRELTVRFSMTHCIPALPRQQAVATDPHPLADLIKPAGR